MPTTFKIPTWRCPECDYAQDFDPEDKVKMKLCFPSIESGFCPACCLGQNPDRVKKQCLMKREKNDSKKTTVSVCDEEEIDSRAGLTAGEKKTLKKKRLDDLERLKKISE